MTELDSLTARLRDEIAVVAAYLAGSDQRRWADMLRHLAARLDASPAATARAVLAMFEGPRSQTAGVTEGDWALDSISLTTDGIAMDRPGVSWSDVMDYHQRVREMYLAAVALWLASAQHEPLASALVGPLKLADYGFGCEIWMRDAACLIRYEFGGHQLAWREDVISEDEARWGMLGITHFNQLAIATLARVQAAGINPWPGNSKPLPAPDMDDDHESQDPVDW